MIDFWHFWFLRFFEVFQLKSFFLSIKMAAAAPQQATKEQQKIFAGFKRLREEQQQLVGEIQRYAAELRETQWIILIRIFDHLPFRNVLATINKWDNTERKFYYRTVDALLEMDGKNIVERLTNNIAEVIWFFFLKLYYFPSFRSNKNWKPLKKVWKQREQSFRSIRQNIKSKLFLNDLLLLWISNC